MLGTKSRTPVLCFMASTQKRSAGSLSCKNITKVRLALPILKDFTGWEMIRGKYSQKQRKGTRIKNKIQPKDATGLEINRGNHSQFATFTVQAG